MTKIASRGGPALIDVFDVRTTVILEIFRKFLE